MNNFTMFRRNSVFIRASEGVVYSHSIVTPETPIAHVNDVPTISCRINLKHSPSVKRVYPCKILYKSILHMTEKRISCSAH